VLKKGVLKKVVLALLAIFAVICIVGCISDSEGEPKLGDRYQVRCVAVKDIDVLEVEEFGEIRIYGVEKAPWWTESKHEEVLEWLRNACEGKEVIIWFGDDEITRDDEGRPYAMVFLDKEEKRCVNTELITKLHADIATEIVNDTDNVRVDFLLHPAWDQVFSYSPESMKDLEADIMRRQEEETSQMLEEG